MARLLGTTMVAVASICVAVSPMAGQFALAQQVPERGVGVADRTRPDYDPVGVRAGGFVVYPSVTTSAEYTDNLFADPANEQDDTLLMVAPEVRVESRWSRHALNLQAEAASRFHSENDGEDFTNYGFVADGRLDITRQTSLAASAGFRVDHEGRGSPDLPNAAAEPTRFTEARAEVSLTQRFNRLSLRPSLAYSETDFDDVALLPPAGGQINNDDRDREEVVAALRIGYEVSPALELFAEGRYRDIRYDNFDDTLGGGGVARRDSDGYEALAGASFDVGHLARGRLGVGYLSREYESSLIPSVDGAIYEGAVDWFVTNLTTLGLFGARRVEETTLAGASGNLVTGVGARVDHELRRNIILGADATYEMSEFEGTAREDDTLALGADITYLVNRNLRLVLDYDYDRRDSTAPGADFTTNSVILSLRTSL
ncbi:outer membrane beta-barrel protein [Pyruvatibacter mobilis]|uniref:Outer membrane beta-barrel protein n=1 Tax=Pyruvatibacter mobilis TaxID=1712261 RepID=A0A845Q7N0_9HYPH|nr:outer membrane beta-barrel protein [Pyruvatibacter mobilis]NBG94645.1 outer membrane beta-barrel protein [Pyruvatibacter mobilis]QJD74154.1 outer membrane beta-barrel protein [Pyruvatibacter mobilis]GGD04599.1 hypothetical protein GCM10011587_05470 [Pyruvatibacter mobilis]